MKLRNSNDNNITMEIRWMAAKLPLQELNESKRHKPFCCSPWCVRNHYSVTRLRFGKGLQGLSSRRESGLAPSRRCRPAAP